MTATQRAAASMSSRAPARQVSSRLFATRTRRRALPGPRPSLVPRASSASTNDSSSSVSVTTFNVLAPCYKRVTNPEDGSIAMEATFSELALERQARIVDMLCSDVRSSILCLQEFWHASEEVRGLYERGLRDAGYVTHSTPRTGGRPDGLLTAVRASEFDVLDRRDILFNDCGDRVAALLHLRHAASGSSETAPAESASSVGDVLLVNTHLLFPHNSNSTLIRLRESFKILEYLHEYQEKMMSEVTENGGVARRLPVVMCGDFNGSVRGAVARGSQAAPLAAAAVDLEPARRDGGREHVLVRLEEAAQLGNVPAEDLLDLRVGRVRIGRPGRHRPADDHDVPRGERQEELEGQAELAREERQRDARLEREPAAQPEEDRVEARAVQLVLAKAVEGQQRHAEPHRQPDEAQLGLEAQHLLV